MNCSRIAGFALAFSTFSAAASATPVTIDFDELATNVIVGSTYAGLGVTFEDARASTNFGLAGSSGGIGLAHSSLGFRPQPADPIVAYFDFDVALVSITGIDVGTQGFQISAFDAISGGSLIDQAEVFGPGDGVGSFFTLTVEGSGIRRIEFSQVIVDGSSEGVVFDDFTFDTDSASTVPVPAALPLLASALAGLGALASRRRKV
jgi:hypothetical protein